MGANSFSTKRGKRDMLQGFWLLIVVIVDDDDDDDDHRHGAQGCFILATGGHVPEASVALVWRSDLLQPQSLTSLLTNFE
ncbi:hypothetical protein KC330_g152 [Hortaea werneckii]|nr:hypothetical protein KC330_g152 [Hortaea werneckii]